MNTFVSTITLGRLITWVAALGCLYLYSAQQAQAGIKKCTLADGRVVFQDTACTVTPKSSSQAAANVENAIPLGIEESWFDLPPIAPYQAVCTTSGCDCGEYNREFKHGLPLAIADALYLDGSWHRLDATLNQLALTADNEPEYFDLKQQSIEAACNILMSQKILRKYSKRALSQLRNQKRYAEDMGLDNPADCDAGNVNVCKHTDYIALYDRIISDIKSLTYSARLTGTGSEINVLAPSNYSSSQRSTRPASRQHAKPDVKTESNKPIFSAVQGSRLKVR